MSFDRLALHYRWLESVLAGPKLQRLRTAWPTELPQVRRAPLVGEGPGRFLLPFLEAQPEVEIVYLDASPAMHRVAQRSLVRSGLSSTRIRWIEAQLPTALGQIGPVDLIATHFFLDCFTAAQLPDLIQDLAHLATPEAHWLVSDFRIPSSGFPRWRAQAIHRLMYAFFRLTTRLPARTLTPPDAWLSEQGFRLIRRRVTDWGLLHADWWGRESGAISRPNPYETRSIATGRTTSA